MPFIHQTVLLAEVAALLKPQAGRVMVDGTLGGGGHAEALLAAGATVIGIDRDPRALEAASARLAPFGERFRAVKGTFGDLASLVSEPVDGLVLDVGVSSPQLDEAERGFSFQHDGPLDMRMSDEGETAAELIARLDEAQLADALYQFGEERFSRPIARSLKARAPQTTAQAVDAVKAAVPRAAWPKDLHVATRTFQGLRIAVNGELEQLQSALEALPQVLKVGGVAAIISFHSLEDRLVKQAFKKLCGQVAEADDVPRGLLPMMPVKHVAPSDFAPLTKKPVVASDEERDRNPRARSAKLRAIERVS
ncbi:MAG: 16S rRNA (cytosine(1402)-N(4))-methyltransferase RsmH [Archangium sp.]|nr:16S rRNA (cytosine(1402)-N(4))-methyltransferase RsmH [Archangium sp.]